MSVCRFTFDHYKEIIQVALEEDYTVFNCMEYYASRQRLPEKYLVLQHNIGYYPHRALEFAKLESELGVTSTYFIRVHARKYNLFNYKSYSDIKKIIKLGHEIGLHAEPVDFSESCEDDIDTVFRKELGFLKLVLGCDINGVSPRRNWTQFDNSDFFTDKVPHEYGLKYWTCLPSFFERGLVATDESNYFWKNYKNETLVHESKCPCKQVLLGERAVYMITQPKNWFHEEYQLML